MKFIGIDVSAASLSLVIRRNGKPGKCKSFANSPEGYKLLIKYINPKKHQTRVCLEATGTYHFDIALCLHHTHNVEIMVIKPKQSHMFAQSLNIQDKHDDLDAAILAEFCERMKFLAWVPPKTAYVRLRSFSRQLSALTKMRTQYKNQLHALTASEDYADKAVIQCQKRIIKNLDKEITNLEDKAIQFIQKDSELNALFQITCSIKGVAQTSAIQILGEVLILPNELNNKQWVKFAGLNPIQKKSGTSVNSKPRISRAGSRHLRSALYMPALSAIRHDAYVRAYYFHLIEDNGLCKMQAITAVMRKLLHAIHGMLRDGKPFDNTRFYHSAYVEIDKLEKAA